MTAIRTNLRNLDKAMLLGKIALKLENNNSLIANAIRHAIDTKQDAVEIMKMIFDQAKDNRTIFDKLVGEEITNKILCIKF